MSNIQKKFAAAIASGAMLLQLASPVLASSTTIVISGNGSDTDNDAKINTTQTTTVQQQNIANIENDVDVDANTGHNDANRNTGGEVEIDTGNADVEVMVDTLANFNWANVDDCLCLLDLLVKIAGNGDNSDNDIHADLASVLAADQFNEFFCGKGNHDGWGKRDDACNDVDVDVDTGKNDAERNTQGDKGADPSIMTGNADAFVEVETTANSNILNTGDGPFPSLPELPEIEAGFGVNLLGFWMWFAGMFS